MEYVMRKLSWREKVHGHISGPVGSILFHIVLIVVMIKYLTGGGDALSNAMTAELKIESKPIEVEPIEEQKIEDVKDIPDDIDMTMPDETLTMDKAVTEEVSQNAPSDAPMDLKDLKVMSNVDSPVTISGVHAGRTASGRQKGLARHGGNALTEAAVMKALEWLRKNQQSDGSWGTKYKIGNTGLAILTFLAHGETPASEKYGPTVEKGIQYLVANLRDDGRFNADGGHAYVYEHGIGTYALADAFTLTQIPMLKAKMEKAAETIIKGQQKSGGWNYYYDDKGRTDSSVIGWQIQGLKAAHIAGATNKGLTETLKKSMAGLKTMQKADGSIGYSTDNMRSNHGLTGVGVLCYQFGGMADSPEAKKGLDALSKVEGTFEGVGGWTMYSIYYVTQAKFNGYGGEGVPWRTWNNQFAKTLIRAQQPDGSWDSPNAGENGQGKVISTTFAALSLQVYYRLLPSFGDKAIAAPVEPAQLEDKGDIEVNL